MKSSTMREWEQVKKDSTESYKELFEKERKFLQKHIPKNSIVLDIGCGTGETIKILSPIAKKIIGIDNDKYAINKCRENIKNLDNVEIFLEDAEKMHFKNNSFDVVICMGTTFDNFGKTKTKILLEIKRVLKNEGIFILSVYNENALEERLKIYRKHWKGFINKGGGTILYKDIISEQFSKDEITKILKNNGFNILELIKGRIFYLIKTQIKNGRRNRKEN